MTAKEAKAYLKLYRESLEKTQEITDHLVELKAEAERLRDHEGQSIQLDAAVARYIDACNEAGAVLDDLAGKRREIASAIDSVHEKHLRKLLREVYIDGKRIVRIAADRDQSYEHICRLHGAALLSIASRL